MWKMTLMAGGQKRSAPSARKVQDVLPMSDPITVVSYDPAWPEIFGQLGSQLRVALGGVALRIDHIGSTAVPGLAAKPIVDVQISVERLEPVEPLRSPLEAAGFRYRATNTERTKRYFREPPGQRRTHLHVRRAGSFSEQFPLLFRDFLRADPAAALDYGRRNHAPAGSPPRPGGGAATRQSPSAQQAKAEASLNVLVIGAT
jgi:GrpB-like predicted nucleotidyltransferase (UPF0157 family)